MPKTYKALSAPEQIALQERVEELEKECDMLFTVVDEAEVLLKVIDSELFDVAPGVVAVEGLRRAIIESKGEGDD